MASRGGAGNLTNDSAAAAAPFCMTAAERRLSGYLILRNSVQNELYLSCRLAPMLPEAWWKDETAAALRGRPTYKHLGVFGRNRRCACFMIPLWQKGVARPGIQHLPCPRLNCDKRWPSQVLYALIPSRNIFSCINANPLIAQSLLVETGNCASRSQSKQ